MAGGDDLVQKMLDSEAVDGPPVVLTSSGGQALGWGLIIVGIVFGVIALSASTQTAIRLGLPSVFLIAAGVNGAIAQVVCGRTGLRYRKLPWPVRVAATDVTAVNVKSVAGSGYERVRIEVERRNARPIKLLGMQRRDSPENREWCEAEAERIRLALGLSHASATTA